MSWITRNMAPASQGRRRVAAFPRNPYFGGASYTSGNLAGSMEGSYGGLGGSADKASNAFFSPTNVHRMELEIASEQSWAAKKLINIPVDDSLVRWRQQVQDEDDDVEAFQEAEKKWRLPQVIGRAVKAARTFGTALTVIKTTEAPLDQPLEPMRIRPGDLRGFSTFDHWNGARVVERDTDFMSPEFGSPVLYEFANGSDPIRVHASRIMRFDGVAPPDLGGWTAYPSDWGLSVLIAAFSACIHAHLVSGGAAHMSQEAGFPVLKMQGFRDFVGGEEGDSDGENPHVMNQAISLHKSIYSTMVIDADDTVERLGYNFGAIPQLIDVMYQLVAAAGDIPLTRFLSQSPGGLNSTGSGDMKNWAMAVAGMQARTMTGPMVLADMVIARDIGMEIAPPFEWLPLVDMSEAEQAKVLDMTTRAVISAVNAFVITEDEARAIISRQSLVGPLPGNAPEPDESKLDLPSPPGGNDNAEEDEGDQEEGK